MLSAPPPPNTGQHPKAPQITPKRCFPQPSTCAATCPLHGSSPCVPPAARGSHARWEGFSLLRCKLFQEINQQLLAAALRAGTRCLGAPPPACRGFARQTRTCGNTDARVPHAPCTVPVRQRRHPCTRVDTRPRDRLCTHMHAGTQRTCAQTYCRASPCTDRTHWHARSHVGACTRVCASACRATRALRPDTSVSRCAHTRVWPCAHTCQHSRSHTHTHTACAQALPPTRAHIPCAHVVAHTCLHAAQAFA